MNLTLRQAIGGSVVLDLSRVGLNAINAPSMCYINAPEPVFDQPRRAVRRQAFLAVVPDDLQRLCCWIVNASHAIISGGKPKSSQVIEVQERNAAVSSFSG